MTETPAYGHCECGNAGEWVVWSRDGRVGTFSCTPHLEFVKRRKENRGGEVEKV